MANIQQPLWLTPRMVVFWLSLIMSAIAHHGKTINGDGILYVHTAQLFLEQGFSAAKAAFSWPLLPILMAGISKISGLELGLSGHILNALFLAGCGVLLLSILAKVWPETVWPTCFVILAIPGLNEYRHELLREYGSWFFLLLAWWFAIRWNESMRWRDVLAAQASVLASALFRPEAIAFLPAMVLWQLASKREEGRLRRIFMMSLLPLFVMVMGLVAWATGLLPDRLMGEVQRFAWAGFDRKTMALSEELVIYAKPNAGNILFWGSLALVPLRIINKMGVFVLPAILAFNLLGGWRAVARISLFGWALLFHFLVLGVFVVDQQFLSGRYVAITLWLLSPWLGYGLLVIWQRFPKVRMIGVMLLLLIAIANLKPTSSSRSDFLKEAGAWLATNASDPSRVYSESPRVLYYAGWYFIKPVQRHDRSEFLQGLKTDDYEWAVLWVTRKSEPVESWIAENNLEIARKFVGPEGDMVLIGRKAQKPN